MNQLRKTGLLISLVLLLAPGKGLSQEEKKSQGASSSHGENGKEQKEEKEDGNGNKKSFAKGVRLLSPALAFGYFDYDRPGDRSMRMLPFSLSYEYGVHDYVGLGGYIGYGSWKRYIPPHSRRGEGKYFHSLFFFGAKGTFHYLHLIKDEGEADLDIDDSKWDLYASLLVGFTVETFNDEGLDEDFDDDTDIDFAPGLQLLGVRYYTGPNFALFIEGGRGIGGYMNLGVTFKF